VTALVRNVASLEARDGLTVLQGTPLIRSDIEKTFTNLETPQAVIVTLNATRETDSPFAKPIAPPRFMADSVANVREIMKIHGTRKIVIMSAYGVGDSFPHLNFLMRPVIRHTNMSAQFQDHDLVDAETKQSEMKWVLVRPAMLKGEVASPVKVIGNTGKGGSFMPSISRASVAGFLVDAVEKSTWDSSTPVICN
jgi:NAD(P)H-binding